MIGTSVFRKPRGDMSSGNTPKKLGFTARPKNREDEQTGEITTRVILLISVENIHHRRQMYC